MIVRPGCGRLDEVEPGVEVVVRHTEAVAVAFNR